MRGPVANQNAFRLCMDLGIGYFALTFLNRLPHHTTGKGSAETGILSCLNHSVGKVQQTPSCHQAKLSTWGQPGLRSEK